MFKRIRAFLTAVLIAATFAFSHAAYAAGNVPNSDIGEYGTWLTDHNVGMFTSELYADVNAFQENFQKQLVADYVPIEAKVGLALMNALTHLGRVLDRTLVRFMILFMLIAYAFWISFEAYNMISGKGNVPKTLGEILKKGIMISVWLIVLHIGIAKIFMWMVGPIITIGTFMSDFILNAVANSAGTSIPDTCGAIRAYTAAHTPADMLIDARAAADIMCVPTRLSGFFYTAVAAGWKWILAGIGRSAMTAGVGVAFILLFMYNIWKFALVALSVIVDLFMTVLMLPFTALSETVGKTNYGGIPGKIYNDFIALFSLEPLEKQIMRFINAALYFVSLSIVVGLCAAIMSGFITTDLGATVPTIENMEFMTTLLAGFLVWHLASKADTIVSGLAGTIDDSRDFGRQIGNDIEGLARSGYKQYKEWARAINDSKKS